MKIVYYHEDTRTIAYDLDSINPNTPLVKNEVFNLEIGSAKRHPKDPPNRKIGNVVAAGRIQTCEMVVASISEGRDGVAILLRDFYYPNVRVFLFKQHTSKNFYITGVDIA
jgi:hypothetical protein